MTVVVFDVDDTLYLERDYVRSGFQAVDRHVRTVKGAEGFFQSAWTLFCNGVRGDTFNQALDSLGLVSSPSEIADLVRVYRHHPPEIALMEDARQAITACQTQGAPIATVTDGPTESQWAKVKALGLHRLADPIIVTEEHGKAWRKPGVLAFEHIQHQFDLPSDCFVYVADNPTKDFIAPAALGWRTARVRRPDGLHAEVASGDDVNAEFPDLRDFGRWLEFNVD